MPSDPHLDQELRRTSARAQIAVQNGRAARTVAARARDVDDCRLLLEMLDLSAAEAAPTTP